MATQADKNLAACLTTLCLDSRGGDGGNFGEFLSGHRMDWDPYVILGVTENATTDEVRKAYRRLARTFHPDANPGDARAAKRFHMITTAYQSIVTGSESEDAPVEFAPPDAVAPNTRAPDEPHWSHHDRPDHPDVSVSADESMTADELPVEAPRKKPTVPLVRADIELVQIMRPGVVQLTVPSYGLVAVKVPPGVDTGTIAPGLAKDRQGNSVHLAVELRVQADSKFRRRGLDLMLRFPITREEAYKGLSKTLSTPAGTVTVRIPPRSRWGDVVRIPCKGIMGPNSWGSLYIEVSPY